MPEEEMPVTIPDDVLAAAHLSEAELRLELAVALFREERLTLAQASRFVELDQFAFQSVLADRESPVHYGIEEVHEDLRSLDALGRR
jgi:predicted HTH domain antitoxin